MAAPKQLNLLENVMHKNQLRHVTFNVRSNPSFNIPPGAFDRFAFLGVGNLIPSLDVM